MKKLIRSRTLRNSLGHDLWKYNWTECRYEDGVLKETVQVVNIGYYEAIMVFGQEYALAMREHYADGDRDNFDTKEYYPDVCRAIQE